MNKISICHLTSAHERYDPRIFYKQCCSLTKTYDVSLVVSDTFGYEKKNQVNIIDLNIKKKNKLSRFYILISMIFFILKNNIRIFHLHDPELLFAIPFIKLKKAKVCFDFHEDIKKQFDVRNYLNFFQKKIFKLFYVIIEKILLNFIDLIIVATDEIKNNYLEKKNLIIINNYPKFIQFSQQQNTITKNNILYLGVITKERGVVKIIDALSNVDKKINFHILGKCYDKKIEDEILNHKNSHRIKMHGWVDPSKLSNFTNSCFVGTALLQPMSNYLESNPTKIYDYAMFGLPILASNFDYWKKNFKEFKSINFINPGNENEIASKINFFYENQNILIKEAKKNTDLVKKKFNWFNEEKKLINGYSIYLNEKF